MVIYTSSKENPGVRRNYVLELLNVFSSFVPAYGVRELEGSLTGRTVVLSDWCAIFVIFAA